MNPYHLFFIFFYIYLYLDDFMVTDFNDQDFSSFRTVKCALCHADINGPHEASQFTPSLVIVCKLCIKKFKDEDIKLMLSLFSAYGGYLGKLKNESHSIEKIIKEITDYCDMAKQRFELDEFFLIMLHRALLHGLTVEKYMKNINSFLAE